MGKEDLAEITAQPLLNYLLALSFRRNKLDFSTAPNLNLIYQDLLDAVYERPWGPGTHPIRKLLSRAEFNQLLDELGLAAWHGAGRTVTETQVEDACERAGLGQHLALFREQARAGAISLLAAFYFRQASTLQGGERTFEFTHKTFGEYLIARRIVRWMDDIHEDRVLNRSNRQRGKTEEDALIKWIEVTGPTAIEPDLLAFVQREVATREHKAVAAWQKTFAELFSDQLRHGLPMHKLGLSTYQEMTFQARNAEEAFLAALWACSETTEERSEVSWPSSTSFGEMVKRLQGQRTDASNAVALRCLSRLNLLMQIHHTIDLYEANLAFSNLERAQAVLAALAKASLESANLRGADLIAASLHGAKLSEANLSGADLELAALGGADLSSANLDGASLKNANLHRANFERANLVGVKNLDQALNLDKVRSWRGARIERRWVERLKLDARKLGLVVVDDLPDDAGLAPTPDLPDHAALQSDDALPDEAAQ